MMFQTSAGFLAGLAATLSLGAVHLESGPQAASPDATSAVYRAVKSDLGIVPSPHAIGRTISIRMKSLPRMSIVFRIPRSSCQEVNDHTTKRDSHHAPAMRCQANDRMRTGGEYADGRCKTASAWSLRDMRVAVST